MKPSEYFGESPPFEEVEIDGRKHYILSMTVQEQEDFFEALPPKSKFMPHLLARVVCDGTGSRLFSDDAAADFRNLPSKVVNPLFRAAQRINGLDAPDEVEKNSEAGPDAGSSTE